MTLSEIAYNIKNILEGGMSTADSNISIKQIQSMIHYHRAQLLLKYTDGGRYISESIITTSITNISDDGSLEIPPLLGFANNKAIVSINYHGSFSSLQTTMVPIYNHADKELFFESRFGPSEDRIFATLGTDGPNNIIYFWQGQEELQTSGFATLRLVLSQPGDGPNGYPIPDELIPTLVETVLSKEFNVMLSVGKDVANNSVDDNIPGVAASQLGQSAQPSANARSRRARTR